MARPQKEGLEYFPLDVDIDGDDKLVVPVSKFGMQGFGIIIKLMASIYKNGYFYPWGELEQYAFVNKVNVDIEIVNQVVDECVKWGFFDKRMFDEHHILTSKGFQKRYVEAAKRRKEITLYEGYVLLNLEKTVEKLKTTISIVNADGNVLNVYIYEGLSNETYTETPQSKVKERKVNQSNNKKTLPRKQKTYSEDSLPFKIAVYLHQQIMKHASDSGVDHLIAQSNMQRWADDCRKLLEIDNVNKDLIREVINFCTVDEFWKINILSARKLREKFKELAIKMKQDKNKSTQPKNSSGKQSLPIVQPDPDDPKVSEQEYQDILNKYKREEVGSP